MKSGVYRAIKDLRICDHFWMIVIKEGDIVSVSDGSNKDTAFIGRGPSGSLKVEVVRTKEFTGFELID